VGFVLHADPTRLELEHRIRLAGQFSKILRHLDPTLFRMDHHAVATCRGTVLHRSHTPCPHLDMSLGVHLTEPDLKTVGRWEWCTRRDRLRKRRRGHPAFFEHHLCPASGARAVLLVADSCHRHPHSIARSPAVTQSRARPPVVKGIGSTYESLFSVDLRQHTRQASSLCMDHRADLRDRNTASLWRSCPELSVG